MRFENLLDRQRDGKITQAEAAEMLGVSERTFRRWTERFEEEGEAGLSDRRLGRPSSKRAPAEEIERMLGLYKDKYSDFTVKHFHEQLQTRHNYKLGYTVTKVHLHRAGVVRHAWLEEQAPLDLIVTLDDATGAIYSAFLVEEEGTASTFRGLREVIEQHGLFCSLYTDRGSHYFYTPQAGGKVSKTQLTQVGRALAHLGIEHIAAYSPEARGRSERAFRTLQDRLPKELRLAGITTIEAANAWLAETYIAEYNRLFAVEPLEEGSAFVPDMAEVWRETLCVIEERVVAKDNTVAWAGRRLQIPSSRLRPHFVKAKVWGHEYPNGVVSIFLGPHRLATYDASGAEISAPATTSMAPCSKPSRPSPYGRAKSAVLTASARAASNEMRVGAWRNRGMVSYRSRNASGESSCSVTNISVLMCR
jgi:transposase